MSAPTSHGNVTSVARVREIPLCNGKGVALVDESDFARLSQHTWYLAPNGYVKRILRWRGDRTTHSVYLHRDVLCVASDVYVDHIDHDLLNCTRANLRECNGSQQMGNMRPRDGTSEYKGVYASGRRWIAQIVMRQRTQYLGTFMSEREAALAYDVAAVLYFGRFSLLNFPLVPELEALRARMDGAA
jgi:hypothetical protein